jgi:hypothetical protein
MESGVDIPLCPPPWDAPSDVIPMVVVAAVFFAGWCLLRHFRKKRARKKKPGDQS